MKTIFVLFLTLTLLFGLHVETPCLTLIARDDLGTEISLVRAPQRIVSLTPSHTEILFALGLDREIVGVTDYCNYPENAKQKKRIGSFADPEIEEIVSLNPDLILAFGDLQKPIVKELEKRGFSVFWLYPRTVREVLHSFERIGELVGKPAAGRELRARVEEKINKIKKKLQGISDLRRPTVFRVMGFDPLGSVGNYSFQNEIYHIAGGKNIFSEIKEDYFEIDLKTLIERNPDVIVICGNHEDKAKGRIKDQEGWDELTAIKKDRILVVPCDLICRPSPRIADTIEKVARGLHPEIFCPSSGRQQPGD